MCALFTLEASKAGRILTTTKRQNRMKTVLSDRPMPQGANLEASEEGTQEIAAPVLVTVYQEFVTGSNTVTFRNTPNIRRCSCAPDRISMADACQGLKLAKLSVAALARKSERVNSGKGANRKGGPGEVLKLTLIKAAGKYILHTG